MSRKEINIFSTSFLDLLSGALAAVIILFILVPKMTQEQQDALEEIERLNVEVAQLSDMMEQLRHSVPEDLYQQIQQQIEALQNTVSTLTQQVDDLQRRVQAAEEENAQLRQQVEALQQQEQRVQELERENQRQRQRIEELERQLAERPPQPQNQGNGISDGKVFGINAKLGVVCMWPENVDVDLYVKDLASGKICFYRAKNQDFGALMEDVTSRRGPDDDRYELFYQSVIVPGTYEIYVNVYAGGNNEHYGESTNANVDGYIVMFPGKQNQQKIPYSNIHITQKGVIHRVGTLTVTENSIRLN